MQDKVSYSTRYAIDPEAAARMGTEELRAHFHVGRLFEPGRVNLNYTHYDRMILGGALPIGETLQLVAIRPTGTQHFLDRREMIAVNIGGPGRIIADGETHAIGNRDMLYLGMATKSVSFASDRGDEPAKFYLLSAPAHQSYPARLICMGDARRIDLGSRATSNERSIFQFIHGESARTCQLVVGMTQLAEGSVWNTMPAHVHDRRMEVYLYFDLPENARILHLLGRPDETRHIVVANEEAVLSPPWSIHSGAGTSSYAFIWAMAGDNADYTDMDPVAMGSLR